MLKLEEEEALAKEAREKHLYTIKQREKYRANRFITKQDTSRW